MLASGQGMGTGLDKHVETKVVFIFPILFLTRRFVCIFCTRSISYEAMKRD